MAKKNKKQTEATTQETTPTTTAPVEATPVAPTQTTTQATEIKSEPTTVKGDNVRTSKSTVTNPVQVVHQLVAEMVAKDPKVRRRDLVDAAIKAGCAYYTARTPDLLT